MAKPFYKQGKYAVTFRGEQGFSETQSGNTQFFLRFDVTHIAVGEEWEAVPNSYTRAYYRVINANTAEFAVEDLMALGYTGDSFKQLDPRCPEPFMFEGQSVMICNHESWGNGEPRESWTPARERAGSAKAVELIDSKKLKQLDMLFGRAFKGEKIGSPAPPKASGPVLPARGSTAGLPLKADELPLASQPRQKPEPTLPPQGIDPATGYANEPAQPPAGPLEIDDDDIPF